MMNKAVCRNDQRQLIEKLFELLGEFASIQKDHAACLAENRLKTLMSWRQQRELSFCRLRQVLQQVGGFVDCDKAICQRLGNELQNILDNEKRLAELAVAQRDRLGTSLCAMRKGKQILKTYSVYQGGSTTPRYLSNKS